MALSPSQQIDARIKELGDWRGVPVWYHNGKVITTGENYNYSSLDGNERRAIDIFEGNKINEASFMALVRAAVELT